MGCRVRSGCIRIGAFIVSGITVPRKLFPADEKNRYFHIFYSESKRIGEREDLESKIDELSELLKKKTFTCARERNEVINEDIRLCGYFVIITSKKMTGEAAIKLYKSRDSSEKLFRGDKSYLGNKSFRVHTTESVNNKIFIEFVALIIRHKIYTQLKEQMEQDKKKDNYMSVPAAIRELEKIEIKKNK